MPMKKRILSWAILFVLVFAMFIGLRHNATWYHTPIGEVTATKIVQQQKSTDQFNNHVTTQTQAVTVKLLNTANKGRMIHLKNTWDSSMAITQSIKKHDQIFLSQADDKVWQFKTLKRDTVWLPIMVFVIGVLLIAMGHAGRLTVLSLAINVALFILTIYLDLVFTNQNIFWLFTGFSLIAAALTLGLVMGFKSRLMWVVYLTVITSTTLAMLITLLVLHVTNKNGIHFELMSYITQLPEPLFFTMTLVGVLGAVMDEATDMIATLFSLQAERPDMSVAEIIQTGRHVGQEIFGALSNTLFLIFIAEQIPMTILYLRNGNNWGFTYMMNLSLGMIQTLISAIGIVLTVPAGIMWVLLVRKWQQRREDII